MENYNYFNWPNFFLRGYWLNLGTHQKRKAKAGTLILKMACIYPYIVGNKAKERISKWVFKKRNRAKFSEKPTFLHPDTHT